MREKLRSFAFLNPSRRSFFSLMCSALAYSSWVYTSMLEDEKYFRMLWNEMEMNSNIENVGGKLLRVSLNGMKYFCSLQKSCRLGKVGED